GRAPGAPAADQRAYDMVIQALSGFLSVQGGTGPPQLVRGIVADKASALTAAYATLAALVAREGRGGRGQRVDVPMLDAYASFMLPDVLGNHTFLPPGDPAPRIDGVFRVWETADGHVLL